MCGQIPHEISTFLKVKAEKLFELPTRSRAALLTSRNNNGEKTS